MLLVSQCTSSLNTPNVKVQVFRPRGLLASFLCLNTPNVKVQVDKVEEDLNSMGV